MKTADKLGPTRTWESGVEIVRTGAHPVSNTPSGDSKYYSLARPLEWPLSNFAISPTIRRVPLLAM